MAIRKPSTALFEVIHSGQRSGSGGACHADVVVQEQVPGIEFPSGCSPCIDRGVINGDANPLGIHFFPRRATGWAFFRAFQPRPRTPGNHAPFALHHGHRRRVRDPGNHRARLCRWPAHRRRPVAGIRRRVHRRTPTIATDARSDGHRARLSAVYAPQSTAPSAAPLRTNDPATVLPSNNGIDTNQARSIGLNYILVQSYPNEKLATEARDFLVKSGVPCTVEKGPKDWASDPSWCSVITTAGYAHIHSPEYESAARNITTLGGQFAGKAKFKRFEPHAYKWKQSSVS